ncbi:ferredoxin family protein [Pseudonocardia petroleophila]|uniref:Ferredoxin n=1 Tax=Pseudonocardia petroleophila TaxID=37331 RepID=A0A7G7MCI9_9PSEU|nr:ferredoxin [Pseudonocardia petroleophila]QNG50500.1 4Fe-4S binding protein [Pseudonocardia petroleophila]
MTYVITSSCIDVLDKGCMDVCPVDCIYEGERKLYIHPDECIDCGACESACPQTAIAYEDSVEPGEVHHVEDNKAFFWSVLPGRDEPLGIIGGSPDIGPVGVDTPLVTAIPRR